MAQGRGSGAIMLLFCMLVLHSEMVHANTYVVGDAGGWTFNVNNWPRGKTFMAGDILEFRYKPYIHNVWQVDAEGYISCTPADDSKKYYSGDDNIQLEQGLNYFICGFPGHCQHGMKIAIFAA